MNKWSTLRLKPHNTTPPSYQHSKESWNNEQFKYGHSKHKEGTYYTQNTVKYWQKSTFPCILQKILIVLLWKIIIVFPDTTALMRHEIQHSFSGLSFS